MSSNKFWIALLCATAILAPSVARATHFGSAPVDPPPADEENFVLDRGSGLDTGCIYRTGGPLIVRIPIDRYVGEVDSDGYLAEPAALVANYVVAARARIQMPAYDVDSGAVTGPPYFPEVDQVSFNGHLLSVNLSGLNNTWVMNEVEVPIEWVKFPSARGSGGARPTAVYNELRVDIDTANAPLGQQLWCMSLDWVRVEVRALAPLVLVHGISADHSSWAPAFANALAQHHIPFANEIDLGRNDSIANNGAILPAALAAAAASFGATKVHVVAHSKGGLDMRRYLSTHYDPDTLRILSLHTLSTPHHGSVQANLSIARRTLNDATSHDPTIAHYLRLDGLAAFFANPPEPPGLTDLQTDQMATFNQWNPFPGTVSLYTHGADADLDNNGTISGTEAAPLVPNSLNAPTTMYRVLRDVAALIIVRHTNLWGVNEWHEISPIPAAVALENDLSVTDVSSRHPAQRAHHGPLDANHSTIKGSVALSLILGDIRNDFPLN